MKRFIPIIVFVLGFVTLSQSLYSVEVKRVEERTIPLSSDATVSLMADEGSVSVKAWDKEEVYLKMTIRAWGRSEREAQRMLDEIEVRVQEGRDRIVIREESYDDKRNFNFFDLFDREYWEEKRWRSHVVDYALMVPKRVQLKIQSDEGDVEVLDTQGSLSVKVDEGDVELEKVVSDDIEIRVDEGDVWLSDTKERDRGLWKIETDEGRILLENAVIQEVDIATDEGEIILDGVEVRRFWLSTDEGDIEADFISSGDGDYRIEADEGDVEIVLPKNANLTVRLRAEEGRIDSDFDLDIRSWEDGEMMEGTLGRGKGTLKAITEEGDIFFIQR